MAIVSFRHNFIFIKTTKTAGTSIEVDLSRHIEDAAIVTPILPAAAGHQPRNWQTERGDFFNHMAAWQIRDLLGPERFYSMLRFCVEREPVAKCISHFHMLRNSPLHNQGGRTPRDWDAYCQARPFPVDVAKYSEVVDGRRVLLVNRVLRYETLEAELRAVLQVCGIPDFKLVAREKAEYATPRLVRPDQVSPAQVAVIRAAFAESCALTGLFADTPPPAA